MAKRFSKIKPINKAFLIIGLFIFISLVIFGIKYKDCFNSNLKICISAKEYVGSNMSFKYPSYFPISELDDEWELKQASKWGLVGYIDFSPNAYFNGGGERLGLITISSVSGATNIDQLEKELKIVKERKEYSNRSGRMEIFKSVPPTTEKVSIGNGIEALKITNELQNNTFGEPTVNYIFYRNNLMYSIMFNYDDYYHKRPQSDYFEGFDLILKTLKVN